MNKLLIKGLLHLPISQPEMVDYGFALAPGEEAFVGVSPEGMHSDEYITKIDMDKRGCYTPSERQLAFYHHYSLLNCYMECVSNYTAKVKSFHSRIVLGCRIKLSLCSTADASLSTCRETPPRPRSALPRSWNASRRLVPSSTRPPSTWIMTQRPTASACPPAPPLSFPSRYRRER